MTSTLTHRLSAAAIAMVAVAAVGLGTTEAWGVTSATSGDNPTVSTRTSQWAASDLGSDAVTTRTSHWA
jgi:hypothetical protein